MPITVATYNVLADAYIRRERYPRTPGEVLEPGRRLKSLLATIAALDTDVICLQEVEEKAFVAMRSHLSPHGYTGFFCPKVRPKPDGCATFYRDRLFAFGRTICLTYEDGRTGRPRSGHVAHLLSLQQEGYRVGIANTHLKWDPPDTPRRDQYGFQQMEQLVHDRGQHLPGCNGWIICGDFNVPPSGDVVALLQDSGFRFSHAAQAAAYTANVQGSAKTIDYLFHNQGLQSEPLPLLPVDADTVLPGLDQPSDHVPVAARFSWA